MRDLMNEQTIVPPWLHDTFLGYGNPNEAHYERLEPQLFRRTVDFKVVVCAQLPRPTLGASFTLPVSKNAALSSLK